MSRFEIMVRKFQMDFPTGRVAQRDEFTQGPKTAALSGSCLQLRQPLLPVQSLPEGRRLSWWG